MDGASLVWFGIGGGAAVFGLSLLYQRFVQRTPRAMQSRGSFILFALLMLLFAMGAVLAGIAASAA
jgi:nitrate reductase gamma subunit